MYNGKLDFISEQNKGTTFIFTFGLDITSLEEIEDYENESGENEAGEKMGSRFGPQAGPGEAWARPGQAWTWPGPRLGRVPN